MGVTLSGRERCNCVSIVNCEVLLLQPYALCVPPRTITVGRGEYDRFVSFHKDGRRLETKGKRTVLQPKLGERSGCRVYTHTHTHTHFLSFLTLSNFSSFLNLSLCLCHSLSHTHSLSFLSFVSLDFSRRSFSVSLNDQRLPLGAWTSLQGLPWLALAEAREQHVVHSL